MALLKIGSVGDPVRALQGGLNFLPTALARLKIDGIFGTRTQGRVMEFQGFNPPLKVDGMFGDLSKAVLDALLKALNNPGGSGAVRSINQEILGVNGPGNLIPQVLPARRMIDTNRFVRNSKTNVIEFVPFLMQAARLGLFAAKKGTEERCVMLMLPLLQRPERMLIVITQGFGQAADALIPLNWTNPLSKKFIEFALLKHVVNRYGPQVIAGKKNMGLMYILRAGSGKHELGPFANDGAFVKQTLQDMQALTGNAFGFETVEAMTYSSGIRDFPTFLASIRGQMNVGTVYNIDPNPATSLAGPSQQFLSGHTSGGTGRPGFEFMPFERWRNEGEFRRPPPKSEFDYMHNKVMPGYCLQLGINLS